MSTARRKASVVAHMLLQDSAFKRLRPCEEEGGMHTDPVLQCFLSGTSDKGSGQMTCAKESIHTNDVPEIQSLEMNCQALRNFKKA
jgi:hypothetical protein